MLLVLYIIVVTYRLHHVATKACPVNISTVSSAATWLYPQMNEDATPIACHAPGWTKSSIVRRSHQCRDVSLCSTVYVHPYAVTGIISMNSGITSSIRDKIKMRASERLI